MEKIAKFWKQNKEIRYLFWGGCTTGFNLLVFAVLKYGMQTTLQTANFWSIVLAIMFAFVVNKWFVFRVRKFVWKETLKEFCSFVGMRIITFFVEFYGVNICASYLGFPDIISKIGMQVMVFVLNYIFSRWVVFYKKRETEDVYE